MYQHENISHFCVKARNVDSVINPDMLFISNHRIQSSEKNSLPVVILTRNST